MQPATQQHQQSDGQIASVLINCFDRDAFKIPFHLEVSIPDFFTALEETSAAIKTGQQKMYGGGIEKIQPISALKDLAAKQSFTQVANLVDELKHTFSRFKKSGDISELGASMGFVQYNISLEASMEIQKIRNKIFEILKKIEVLYKLSPRKGASAKPVEIPDHFVISSIFYSENKIEEFAGELRRKGLLPSTSPDDCLKKYFVMDQASVSKNKTVLNWQGSLPELQCLLSFMKRETIITNGALIWLTAAKLFTHKGEKIDPEKLRRQHLNKTRDEQRINALQKLVSEIFGSERTKKAKNAVR